MTKADVWLIIGHCWLVGAAASHQLILVIPGLYAIAMTVVGYFYDTKEVGGDND